MEPDIEKLSKEGIKEDLSRGRAIKLVRAALGYVGFDHDSIKHITKPFRKRLGVLSYFVIFMLVISIGFGVFKITNVGQASKLAATGYTLIGTEKNYTDYLGLEAASSYNYTWFISNPGILKTVKLNGILKGHGNAKVLLESDERSYLIFDSSKLGIEGLGSIAGHAVDEISQVGNETSISSTADENLSNAAERSIAINIEGGGLASTSDALYFNIVPSFSWDADYSRLCAKWELNNGSAYSSFCYGNEECCGLLGLESRGSWNESFVLSYSRYGASLENDIYSTLIFANYSLDPSNPYVNITYSNLAHSEANFYYSTIEFNGVCINSCLLPALNDSSYKLVIIVENATLSINSIDYLIQEPEAEETAENETTKQYKAVIGRPVKWEKKVVLKKASNISIDIPEEAVNIQVNKIEKGKRIEIEDVKVKTEKTEENLESYNLITAAAVADVKRENTLAKISTWLKSITGYAVAEEPQQNITLVIAEPVQEVEIIYYTEAPQAVEEEISPTEKEIVISSDVHYEDILAFTDLPTEAPADAVHLYWLVDGSRQEVDIDTYDTNGNELVDYIEWIVPYLSNQTYQLVIEITKASHLDAGRNYISDIYDEVYKLDGNWSETINNNEYIRVTFEQPLDNTRDITLYARSAAGNITAIEVYTENNYTLIALFENISNEGWYKVYLTNLQGSHETFDLRILGSAEFDYIVDPISASGNISFVPPTPDNNSIITTNYTTINVSVKENVSMCALRWSAPTWTNWTSNPGIVNKLPANAGVGDSSPEIFYKNSTWYMIAGGGNGNFYGYNWSEADKNWTANSNITKGLSDVGAKSKPEVFYKNDTWYMIAGDDDSAFNGFNWSEASKNWSSDSGITLGLPADLGTLNSAPDVFYKDSAWYMIVGKRDGTFAGYNWSETNKNWTSDGNIIAGLGDIGPNNAVPTVFYKDYNWYLIAGDTNGAFHGYNWSETNKNWTSDGNITKGLTDIGVDAAPDAFYKNSAWYMIIGEDDGGFNGFNKTLTLTIQTNYTMGITNADSNTYANYTVYNLVNGTNYTYYVWCNDTAGNSNQTENRSVMYVKSTSDTTPPTYAAFQNNASDITKTNGIVNWSITLSDTTGLSGYIFANNNSGTLTNGSYKEMSGTSVFVNETATITKTRGNYICGQFWFNDSSNNKNQTLLADSGACFTVANTAPAAPTILSPYDNEVNNTIKIEFTSTDADNDVITYKIYINNSLNISAASNITVWNASDGFYGLNISASDGYNSSANSSVVYFTMDATTTAINIIYPINGSNISSNSIDLNASAYDSRAASLTYYWVINGTTNSTTVNSNSTFNASDGYYNLTLFVSDGLQNGSSTILFRFDTAAPTVNILYPINGSNISSNSISINATASDTRAASLTYYWVINGTLNSTTVNSNSTFNASDGYYNLTLKVSDGLQNGSSTILFRFDTAAPTVNILYPINGSNISSNSIDLNASAYDSRAASLTYYWVINGTLNSTTINSNSTFNASDGYYNLTLKVSDGLQNGSALILFTLDTTAPAVSIIYPPNELNISANSIALNATASDTRAVSLTYYWVINGTLNSTTTNSNSTFNASDGYYNLTLKVSDGLQNGSATVHFTFDTTGPSITIISPISQTYTVNWTIANVTTNENASNCVYSLDNVANISMTLNTTTSFIKNVTNIADGAHVIRFYCNDTLNNTGFASRSFAVDSSQMSITLWHPLTTTYFNYNQNITFNYTVTESVGIAWCKLYGNWSGAWQENQTNTTAIESGAVHNFTANLTDGSYVWNIECNSTVDIREFSQQGNQTFVVDTVQPSFSNQAKNTTPAINGDARLNITITDANCNSYKLFWNSSGTLQNISSGSCTSGSVISTTKTITTAHQNICWGYWANDLAGNSNSSNLDCFTAGNTAPQAPVILSPYETERNNTRKIEFYSIDADNDQLTYQIYINNTLNITASTNITVWNGSDGYYNLTITSFDSQVYSANSTVVHFTMDTNPPTVNIAYPTNELNISNNSISINATAVDNFSSSLTYYWVINRTLNSTTVNSNSTFNASDGYYNLTLFVSDSLQNGSAQVLFRLDTAPPSWSSNETNASSMKINGNATFNITVTDNGAGLSYYIFSWNGTGAWNNNTNGSISGSSARLVINKSTNLSQGNIISYIWYANDSLNHWNSSLLYTFTVANSLIAFSNAVNGSPNFRKWENFTANITISDPDSDLSSYIFSTNNSGTWQNDTLVSISGSSYRANSSKNISLSRGSYVCWKYYANDTANSIQASDNYCFAVANTLPEIPSIIFPANNTNYSSIPYINYTSTDVDADTITYYLYVNGTLNSTSAVNLTSWNASDGYYNMTASAYDNYNFSANSSAVYFTLDSAAPAVNIIYPANELNISSNSISINASAYDSRVSSLTYYWVINGTLNSTTINSNSTFNASDGYYNLTLFVSDGLQNGSSASLFRLDTVAPAVSILYPINNSNISSNSISLNASAVDNLSSSLTYYWVINGTLNSTTVNSNSTFNASDGYYNLTLFVSDGVQNGSAKVSFRLDASAPAFSNPETNTTPPVNENLRMNITITDVLPSDYKFFWNGTGAGFANDSALTYASGQAVSTTKTVALAGAYICWGYWANDSLGNSASSALTCFTVGNTAPAAPTIYFPVDGGNYRDIPYINYSSTDVDGNALTYYLYINGTLNATTATNITDWNASDNYYNLTVRAHDGTQFSAGASIYFKLDTTGPSITIISPISQTYTVNWTIANVTTNENASNCVYSLDGAANASMTLNTTTNFIKNVTNIADGTHTIRFYCNDTLNNTGSASRTFGIDTNPPAITLWHPLTTAYLSYRSDILFNYTVTEAAGVDWCRLYGNWSGTWQINQTNTTLITSGSKHNFTANLSDGNYKWNIECNSSLNIQDFSAQGNQTFVVDTAQPSFSNQEMNATPKINEDIRLNITVTDSNCDSYKFFWDHPGSLQNVTSGACASGSVISTTMAITLAHQDVCWGYWANDSAGNSNSTKLECFTIANTPPTAPNIVYPINNTNYSSIPYINYSSTDTDADTITYYLYINGTLNSTSAVNLTSWNASDGYYNMTVSAYDNYNFSANSSAVYFTLDSTAPLWYNNITNFTSLKFNQTCQFNVTWNDSFGLAGYIFSSNITGSWINSSYTLFSGTNNISANISTTNLTRNNVFGWMFYANDTAGNRNQTDIFLSTINNTPLRLAANIPNQTWNEDTANNNAINLSQYFTDVDGDALAYNSTNTSNIIVAINQTTGMVSFSQPANWFGVEYIIFNASDGEYYNLSNNVTLTVNDVADGGGDSGGGGGGGGDEDTGEDEDTGDEDTGEEISTTTPTPEPTPQSITASEEIQPHVPCSKVEGGAGAVSMEETKLDADIPEGYSIIMGPFDLKCGNEFVDLTLSLPDDYADIKAMVCKGGICVDKVIPQVSYLDCGGKIVEELREDKVITADLMPIKIEPKKITITDIHQALESGNSSIQFKGELLEEITASIRSASYAEEAKNPALKIISTPIIIKVDKAMQSTIKLPYVLTGNIDRESAALYGKIQSGWEYIGGEAKGNIVTADVDLSRYLDKNSEAMFAVMGIICVNCLNSSLDMEYAPEFRARDALIMIHGMGSSPETYKRIIDDIRLTKQPFAAYTFGYPTSVSIEENARQLADHLEAISSSYDSFYMAAHSLGGLVAQKALQIAYQHNYGFVKNVKKVILVGVPNEGSPAAELYDKLFNELINTEFVSALQMTSNKVISQLVEGMIIDRVPGIEYYVITGSGSTWYSKTFFESEKNDGIVSVKSAQRIGEDYINDMCKNYWEINVTHTNILHDDASRKIIERIIAQEIYKGQAGILGHNQYFSLKIDACDPADKYVIIGKKVGQEAVYDPTGCSCGNSVCGIGEDEINCPADCAVILAPKEGNVLLKTSLAVGVTMLVANTAIIYLNFFYIIPLLLMLMRTKKRAQWEQRMKIIKSLRAKSRLKKLTSAVFALSYIAAVVSYIILDKFGGLGKTYHLLILLIVGLSILTAHLVKLLFCRKFNFRSSIIFAQILLAAAVIISYMIDPAFFKNIFFAIISYHTIALSVKIFSRLIKTRKTIAKEVIEKKLRKNVPLEKIKKQFKKPRWKKYITKKAIDQIISEAREQRIDNLRKYIEERIEKKTAGREIIEKLLKSGWNRRTAVRVYHEVISEIRNQRERELEDYVKDKIERGATREEITDKILSSGWKKETTKKIIKKAISELKEQSEKALSRYVADELEAKIPEEAITKKVLSAGWENEEAQQVIRKAEKEANKRKK